MPRAVLASLAIAACGTLGPREVTGPPDDRPVVDVRAAPARLIVAEPYPPGAHLVFVDESGHRVGDVTGPPETASIDLTPAWSPDGKTIAFASSRGREAPSDTSLWLVGVGHAASPRRLTDESAIDLSPAFAPDGRTLVFASTRPDGHAGLHLWTVGVDGEEPQSLTVVTAGAQEYAPQWAHRGGLIAFTQVTVDRARHVAILDGHSVRVLADGALPAFSPDDRTVVFVAPAPGELADHQALWSVAVDGGEPRLIVDEPLADLSGPRYDAGGRFVLASALVRGERGKALFSTLVFVDLEERPARLRALVDPFPSARMGVAAADQPLDAAALRAAPTYVDALRRMTEAEPE